MNDFELKHAALSIPPTGGAFATFLGYLPEIAAAASIVWIAIQAYYFIKEKRKGK